MCDPRGQWKCVGRVEGSKVLFVLLAINFSGLCDNWYVLMFCHFWKITDCHFVSTFQHFPCLYFIFLKGSFVWLVEYILMLSSKMLELLNCALLQCKYHSVRQDLFSQLIPLFLANHTATSSVIQFAWISQVECQNVYLRI